MDGDKQLFLVRVWRQRDQFRASVRATGNADPEVFDRPEQVGEFLVAALAAADASSRGGRHDADL